MKPCTKKEKVEKFGYRRENKETLNRTGLWRLEGGKEEKIKRAREGKDDVISKAGYQVGGQERERSRRNPRSAQLSKTTKLLLSKAGRKKGEEKWMESPRREEKMQESENTSLQEQDTKHGKIHHAPVQNHKCEERSIRKHATTRCPTRHRANSKGRTQWGSQKTTGSIISQPRTSSRTILHRG